VRVENLASNTGELRDVVLPHLLGQVFHVTTGTGLHGIQRSGAIVPNSDGRFPWSTTQSPSSYGRSIAGVCLVDLRTATREVIDDALDRYYFLDPFTATRVNAFILLGAPALNALVPNHVGRGNFERLVVVPNVEVWYPGRLSLRLIDRVIRVKLKRPGKWDHMNLAVLEEIFAQRKAREK
jgi:hypothetical protein